MRVLLTELGIAIEVFLFQRDQEKNHSVSVGHAAEILGSADRFAVSAERCLCEIPSRHKHGVL